jgi:hypothetical protein
MRHSRIFLQAPAIIFGLATVIMMHGCNKMKGDKSKTAFIDSPFKDIAPKGDMLTVNNTDSAQTFNLRGGTVISVPDHAFVDEKGNPVSGKVDLSYNEFHTAADIIVSGIPMTYDSAGTVGNFQTAGMFQIKGYQNGKPVFIAKDKKIDVQMGSFARGEDYNLYYLDTNARNWNYLGHGTQIDNPSKRDDSILANIPKKPIEPKQYNDKTPVFDMNVSLENYPELKEFKGLVWQYAGSDPKLNPENNKWVYGFHWKKATIEPYNLDSSQFRLLLDNGKTKFESVVTPVLKGKNLEKAREKFNKKMERYKEDLAKRERQLEFLAKEASILRSVSVFIFGTFNWDKIYAIPQVLVINANFDVEGQTAQMENPIIYLVTGNDRAVIRFNEYNFKTFYFSPLQKNKIVAITSDMNVSVYSSDNFKNLDIEKMRESKAYNFHLIPTGKKISSTDDLKKIIASL